MDTHKTVQYQLRLSEELRDKIRKSSEAHNRSMNADIIARLEHTFDDRTEILGIFNQNELEALAIEIAKLLSDNRELSQEFIQIINSPNKKPTA